MFGRKPIQDISEADLLNLIGTTSESQQVDFKEFAYPPLPDDELSTNNKEKQDAKDRWKHELCKDIASFANASGGWIICGVKEKGGEATEISGLRDINAERVIARLETSITSGIEPRIPGLQLSSVNLSSPENSKVIIIYIPRSFAAPHRVKANNVFPIRRSGRKDAMNIDELRAAFNLSESFGERIKAFRRDRVEAIAKDLTEEIPVLLSSGVRIVLHVVPVTFSDSTKSVYFKDFEFARRAFDKDDNGHLANYAQFNFDGVLLPTRPESSGNTEEYFQIFRNGSVEYVYAKGNFKDSIISLAKIEYEIVRSLGYAVRFQENLGIDLPSAIMVSLLGVKDNRFMPGINRLWGSEAEPSRVPIHKDKILLPDAIIENFQQDLRLLLKGTFDVLWNLGGWAGSKNYDDNGNWIEPKV